MKDGVEWRKLGWSGGAPLRSWALCGDGVWSETGRPGTGQARLAEQQASVAGRGEPGLGRAAGEAGGPGPPAASKAG